MGKTRALTYFFLKELLYKRIFFVSLFIGLCFVILSFFLGPLSFTEESRLAINFSLAGSQIALIFLSVLVGADFLRSDLETRAIHSFLARPISRTNYFFSKALAFAICLIVMVVSMWLVFMLISTLVGVEDGWKSIIPFMGFFIEALILFSLGMLFSLFSSSLFSIGLTFSLFLAGHWVEVFGFLSEKSTNIMIKLFGLIFSKGLPNLESLNWKAHLTYNEWMEPLAYFKFSIYGFAWVLALLLAGSFIFSKKDLS